MQETNRIEFKRGLGDRFERSVVSFLNYVGGGEILIGVDDDGNAVGIDDPDTMQCQIVDRIRNNIRPQTLGLFDVVLTKVDGKNVIRVIVSCGTQRPYYIRKKGIEGCFIRVGSSSQVMSEQMFEELLAGRQRLSLQTMPSPRQKLTFKQLCIHYGEKQFEPTEQFIESLDLRQSNGDYNYAAYLLADNNGVSIKIAVYAGTDKVDLIETHEYGNRCLLTATQRLLDRLESENRTYAQITSKRRLERERINSIALREAVINAIVHNDYSLGFPLVEIFSDRVVITSCGGLVPGLSEEAFFKCRSMPRNRELMRVFRDMELVEQIGSGMSRIMKVYGKSIFELSHEFTVVTLPCEESFGGPDMNADTLNNDTINDTITFKKSAKNARKDQNDTINDTINFRNEITKSKKGMVSLVIRAIQTNPRVTVDELVELTGWSRITVMRKLKEYQEAEFIRREGARKNGRWVVVG